MSEDEIIKGITNIIYTCNDAIEDKEWYDQEEIESAKEQLKFTEGLLDLYNKEKEKNSKITVVFGGRRYGTEAMILKDYVSKDKIKDKVEYIRFMVDDDNKPYEIVKEVNLYLDLFLQELLEERN